MKITEIPLSVWNRALELYNEPAEDRVDVAMSRLASAEGRKDITTGYPGITPFAQAVAEYLSCGEGYEAVA